MQVGEQALIESCGAHLARYKLPKAIVFRDEIVRSPSGKADYRWAREQVTAGRSREGGHDRRQRDRRDPQCRPRPVRALRRRLLAALDASAATPRSSSAS
jgi:hypothetical protein